MIDKLSLLTVLSKSLDTKMIAQTVFLAGFLTVNSLVFFASLTCIVSLLKEHEHVFLHCIRKLRGSDTQNGFYRACVSALYKETERQWHRDWILSSKGAGVNVVSALLRTNKHG